MGLDFKRTLMLRGLSPNTIETYLVYERLFSKAFVDGFDQDDINNFLTEHNSNVCRSFLKLYLEWLEDNTPKDQWVKIKIIKKTGRVKKKEVQFLKADQVYGFINYLYGCGDLKFSCIVALLFEGGLRVSECLKLKWDKILWKDNKIKVPEDTKTGFRVVLFSENTKNLLNEYQSSIHYNPDIVFYFEVRDPNKSKVINHKSIRTRVFKKIQEYGLKYFGFKIHPHVFRHSCGYHLANDLRIPIDEVAIYLGHSKIDTTRIYAHKREDIVLGKVKKGFS